MLKIKSTVLMIRYLKSIPNNHRVNTHLALVERTLNAVLFVPNHHFSKNQAQLKM